MQRAVLFETELLMITDQFSVTYDTCKNKCDAQVSNQYQPAIIVGYTSNGSVHGKNNSTYITQYISVWYTSAHSTKCSGVVFDRKCCTGQEP